MSTWVRVDIVPPRFRCSFIADRMTVEYRTRRAACHLRKACRPVPCPPFGEARFTVLATSHADQERQRRIHAATEAGVWMHDLQPRIDILVDDENPERRTPSNA